MRAFPISIQILYGMPAHIRGINPVNFINNRTRREICDVLGLLDDRVVCPLPQVRTNNVYLLRGIGALVNYVA